MFGGGREEDDERGRSHLIDRAETARSQQRRHLDDEEENLWAAVLSHPQSINGTYGVTQNSHTLGVNEPAKLLPHARFIVVYYER